MEGAEFLWDLLDDDRLRSEELPVPLFAVRLSLSISRWRVLTRLFSGNRPRHAVLQKKDAQEPCMNGGL